MTWQLVWHCWIHGAHDLVVSYDADGFPRRKCARCGYEPPWFLLDRMIWC